jgi:hypothetical protein
MSPMDLMSFIRVAQRGEGCRILVEFVLSLYETLSSIPKIHLPNSIPFPLLPSPTTKESKKKEKGE